MKLYQVAYKNLLRRKMRTLLTIVGIALSSWVLLSLLGFNQGYQTALNKDIDNMGFQILVTAKGCPYEAATLMLKGGVGLRYLKEASTADIIKHQEVDKITKMLMEVTFDPNKGQSGGYTAFLGVDPDTFPAMKAYQKFKQGAWFTKEDALEAVLGYEAAELEQREVGDFILITEKNIQIKIVGILKRTGTQDDGTIYLPLRTTQKIFHKEGKITGVGVKVKKEVDINKFEEKIYDLPDVQVVSLVQVKETIMNLVATARVMIFSIALIAIIIAMLGVMNTVLMSILERFQEIGILKSMGAMPKDIFFLIWMETCILCFSGGLLGAIFSLLLASGTDILVRQLLPYAPTGNLIQINAQLFGSTILVIILIGLFSGFYPSWKAARIRPIEAIRKEDE